MADNLSVTEEARLYRKEKEKKKHQRALDRLTEHVTWLRVTEFGVGVLTSGIIGIVQAAKPDWSAAYNGWGEMMIRAVPFLTGGGIFFISGDKKGADYMREVGGGMIGAGLYGMSEFGAKRLYLYLKG